MIYDTVSRICINIIHRIPAAMMCVGGNLCEVVFENKSRAMDTKENNIETWKLPGSFSEDAAQGIRQRALAGKFIHKKAEPFIVTVEPRKEKPSVYSHPGQEFNYVLSGTLKMHIYENDIVLYQGDSIFFDSSS